ncbi:MAG: carbohydrate kinase family protein [Spirochaetaceae bacterium]|nr:carbohydrate kinase family protein [Spirochaetaceae bacterium]
MLTPIHLAGNCAVDVLFQAAIGEVHAKLRILEAEPSVTLAGGAGWPAYLLAQLGHPVQLNTRLGRDLFGTVLRDRLARAGVEVLGPDAAATAVSVISAAEGGLRSGFVYPGEPIDWRASLPSLRSVPGTRWFFASGYSGVGEADFRALKDLFIELRDRQVRIVFDPSPWFAQRVERDAMFDLISSVYCLSATQSELAAWFPVEDPAALARHVLKCGPACAVVKQGANGATVGTTDGTMQHVPTDPVAGANTVGAGDTFSAGLLHGLSTDLPALEAVALAVRMATEVVRVGRAAFRVTAFRDGDGDEP